MNCHRGKKRVSTIYRHVEAAAHPTTSLARSHVRTSMHSSNDCAFHASTSADFTSLHHKGWQNISLLSGYTALCTQKMEQQLRAASAAELQCLIADLAEFDLAGRYIRSIVSILPHRLLVGFLNKFLRSIPLCRTCSATCSSLICRACDYTLLRCEIHSEDLVNCLFIRTC